MASRTSTPAKREGWRIVAVIVLGGLALLLFGVSAHATWRQAAFRRTAIETEGRIVALAESRTRESSGRWSVSYFPVYAYTLPNGRVVQRTSGTGGNPPPHAVGETVRVLYDPAEPDRAMIHGFMESWMLPLLVGTVGAAFGLAALLFARGRSGPLDAGPVVPGAKGLPLVATLAGLRREDTPAGPRWIVQARGPGQTGLFESDPLSFDPTAQMRDRSTVTVWIGRGTRNGAHEVDLSFLSPPRHQETPAPHG